MKSTTSKILSFPNYGISVEQDFKLLQIPILRNAKSLLQASSKYIQVLHVDRKTARILQCEIY